MTANALLERVSSGDFKVGVVGLGRVGLPLGIAFARRGVGVIGIDRNEELIAQVQDGVMPFHENGGDYALKDALACGKLSASANYETLVDADIIFMTVATGLNNEQPADNGPSHLSARAPAATSCATGRRRSRTACRRSARRDGRG